MKRGHASDAMQFLSSREFTFREGLPSEKHVALRQCIEKFWINKTGGEIKRAIYLVPVVSQVFLVNHRVSEDTDLLNFYLDHVSVFNFPYPAGRAGGDEVARQQCEIFGNKGHNLGN